ncbi:ABC transporter ATP-binding protein [Treponema sp. SP13]|uniref:ABC transporter ATP-binding protein n=1 Tax=Treponema sp. SP13 TaxID=2789742 RepID=UPI003D8C1697
MTFSVRGGCFAYGTERVLDRISFSVESGEVLCVLGPNGAGKTTLLKCMTGLLKWDEGETLIDGRVLESRHQRDLWRRVAYVPQAKGIAFGFTAFDMVLLGRSAHLGTFEQPDEKDKRIALRAMEDTGIASLRDKLCTEMSGGELQMVLIARSLAVEPEMLVFDEPESNLDFKNQLIILNTIYRLAKERRISAVVSTHYPAHAMKIADKALILNKSGESTSGAVEKVITEDSMKKAFGVQVCINEFEYQNAIYKDVVPLYLV